MKVSANSSGAAASMELKCSWLPCCAGKYLLQCLVTQLGNAAVIWSTAEGGKGVALGGSAVYTPLHVRRCRLIHNHT